jgi:hypothetical protein
MDLPNNRSPKNGWLQQAVVRMRTRWPVKIFGTATVMTLFFMAYFLVLKHPIFPVTTMPAIFIDRLIPFQPATLPVYFSLWFYLSLAPALLLERREMISYVVATVAMSVIGLAIFLLWPTTIFRPEADWSAHPSFAFLMTKDAAGNACPSLHVAFAVFTAIWLERILRQIGAGLFLRAANWLWCGGIFYSTIATRQHVALDVIAGAGLGIIIAWLQLRWLRA